METNCTVQFAGQGDKETLMETNCTVQFAGQGAAKHGQLKPWPGRFGGETTLAVEEPLDAMTAQPVGPWSFQ